MNILIVDDEEGIRSIIKEYCINDHFDCEEAANGEEALEKLKTKKFDLIILDIMMPKMDGFSLLKNCPKEKRIPTIVLSSRGEEYDKLTGFDLEIDDYVTKPFSPKELIARVKAVLSRTKKKNKNQYTYDTLEVNFDAHTVKIDNKLINLTPKEYDILIFFLENKNIAISRERLLENIWGFDFYGDDRTIDTHIKMLRNNLGKYRENIKTVRGLGYKYVEEEE
ncbi:MAG: response regulator transcription factor [Bacilli bacterium]|nr:response regulator transcription factor [Bacilli bacterium]